MIRPLHKLLICLAFCAGPAVADTVVAARTIPARSLIGPDDLQMRDIDMIGGISDPAPLIGQEARVALYAGRPIRPGDVGPPAIVERNQIVPLTYRNGAITIVTEGRAMERAAPGDLIRVMNLASRTTVMGRIDPDGSATVSE